MFAPHAKRASVSRSPSSSVVIGGRSRPQLRGAGPSRRARIGPGEDVDVGVRRGRVEQRREPARARADVVVDEHHQLARRALDAGVARDVQAERSGMRLVACAEALGQAARRGRRARVVDHEHLRAELAGVRGAIDASATSR